MFCLGGISEGATMSLFKLSWPVPLKEEVRPPGKLASSQSGEVSLDSSLEIKRRAHTVELTTLMARSIVSSCV